MINNELVKQKSLYVKIKENVKGWVKNNRNSKNIIVKFTIKSLYFTISKLYTIKRLCVDKGFRAIFYMRVFNSKRVQQTTPTTLMNRYPVIFSACSDYLKEKENIKILSYGCSTGEEVLTLRQYFPNATIVGAEINKNSLEICKKLSVDEKIKFIKSTPNEIKKQGKFDAVFCMAVLQRTPHMITEQGVKSLKKIYPFEKFDQQIIELNDYVKQEGILVIHFSQYSFEDTNISKKYKALGEYNQNDYKSSIFDKNSNLINNPAPRKSVFIKLEN